MLENAYYECVLEELLRIFGDVKVNRHKSLAFMRAIHGHGS